MIKYPIFSSSLAEIVLSGDFDYGDKSICPLLPYFSNIMNLLL